MIAHTQSSLIFCLKPFFKVLLVRDNDRLNALEGLSLPGRRPRNGITNTQQLFGVAMIMDRSCRHGKPREVAGFLKPRGKKVALSGLQE